MDITIDGEEMQNLDICLEPLNRQCSLSNDIFYDKGPRITRSHPQNHRLVATYDKPRVLRTFFNPKCWLLYNEHRCPIWHCSRCWAKPMVIDITSLLLMNCMPLYYWWFSYNEHLYKSYYCNRNIVIGNVAGPHFMSAIFLKEGRKPQIQLIGHAQCINYWQGQYI